MSEMKLIGLLGGLGPAATVHYYESLNQECRRRGVSLRLIMNQGSFNLVLGAAGRGDTRTLAEHLARRLNELGRAGAELLAIAAVAPHVCMPDLTERIRSPIIDLVELVGTEIHERGIARVALMGTRATVTSRLFHRLDAVAVDPTPDQVGRVHDLYVGIVQRARVDRGTADALGDIATEYKERLGVEAIVLAGTELALVPAKTWRGIGVVDCAKLHVQGIITAALRPEAEGPQ